MWDRYGLRAWPLRRVLGILFLAAALCAPELFADDPLNPKRFPVIKKLKKLYPSTGLVGDGRGRAIIVAPDKPGFSEAAARLQAAIRKATGATLPVRRDTDFVRDWRVNHKAIGRNSLILLGNVNNNAVMAWLYGEFYVVADSIYPGKGGYVIRTVHDPFATGVNALALAGSDAAGVERAVSVFAKKYVRPGRDLVLAQPVVDVVFTSKEYPFLPEGRSKPGYVNKREPRYQPVSFHLDRLRGSGLADGQGRILHNPKADVNRVCGAVFGMGWSYFRTGNRAFLPLMKGVIEKNRHVFKRVDKASARLGMGHPWDLIEELPIWSDADRLGVTNALLRCAMRGHEHRGMHKQALEGCVQAMDENHGTHSAIRNVMNWQYLMKYYPKESGEYGRYWMKVSKIAFDGQASTFELAEDGAGYLTFNPDNSMDYAVRMRDMTYFKRGVARHKARYCALACVNNLGFGTGFGDSPSLAAIGAFNVLARAVWESRDPRLSWVMRNIFPQNAGLRVAQRCIALNLDVKPVRPGNGPGGGPPGDWTGVVRVPIYVKTLTKGEGRKKLI